MSYFLRLSTTEATGDLCETIADELNVTVAHACGLLVTLESRLWNEDHRGDLRPLGLKLARWAGWTETPRNPEVAAVLLRHLTNECGEWAAFEETRAKFHANRAAGAARVQAFRVRRATAAEPSDATTADPLPADAPDATTHGATHDTEAPTRTAARAGEATPLVDFQWNGVTHRMPADAAAAIKGAVTPDPGSALECNAAWEAWRLWIGEVPFGRFRKEVGPALARYGFRAMLDAFRTWRGHRRAVAREDGQDALRFLGLPAFLGQCEHVVRLGAQPIEDANGRPTEHGMFTTHYTGRASRARRA